MLSAIMLHISKVRIICYCLIVRLLFNLAYFSILTRECILQSYIIFPVTVTVMSSQHFEVGGELFLLKFSERQIERRTEHRRQSYWCRSGSCEDNAMFGNYYEYLNHLNQLLSSSNTGLSQHIQPQNTSQPMARVFRLIILVLMG